MYNIEPVFWAKLIFLIVILLLLFKAFSIVMSKWLKVERKTFFSYHYVNDQHKKVDWTIRITFLVVIVGYAVAIPFLYENGWDRFPTPLIFVFIMISEVTRAVMEWKYAENRKAYLLTISELGFMMLVITLVFATDFFGIGR